MSDPLEVELWVIMSHFMWVWELSMGSLKEQYVVFTEPFLQPFFFSVAFNFMVNFLIIPQNKIVTPFPRSHLSTAGTRQPPRVTKASQGDAAGVEDTETHEQFLFMFSGT